MAKKTVNSALMTQAEYDALMASPNPDYKELQRAVSSGFAPFGYTATGEIRQRRAKNSTGTKPVATNSGRIVIESGGNSLNVDIRNISLSEYRKAKAFMSAIGVKMTLSLIKTEEL